MCFPLYSEESGTGGERWEADHHPVKSLPMELPLFLVLKVEEGEWLSKHLYSSSLGLPGTGGEGWPQGA